MWYAFYYFGNFIGPILGGGFMDKFGFPAVTLGLAFIYSFVLIVDLTEITYKKIMLNGLNDKYERLSLQDELEERICVDSVETNES